MVVALFFVWRITHMIVIQQALNGRAIASCGNDGRHVLVSGKPIRIGQHSIQVMHPAKLGSGLNTVRLDLIFVQMMKFVRLAHRWRDR